MYLLSAECIWLPIFGMNQAWQQLPALRQFPPPFSLLPPPHPAPPLMFTFVPCDVHGPMCTILNGSRTRIEVHQCWTCFISVNEIGAHILVMGRAEQRFYWRQRGGTTPLILRQPLFVPCSSGAVCAPVHNVQALRSISNRGSDGHARASAFRE
ncbi:hypothetical protein B0H14DRAFT_2965354, partial [Mycena olivaceomarginata]